MYYRYKNNNNKDDISYSFSLESYIDSLNNDYSFNDYKIKVNNKTYDELSIEHNRLHNEINKLINEDMFSTEGILDNIVNKIKDFGKWLDKLFDQVSNLVEISNEKNTSKLKELKSKNIIYKNFKPEIFKSVNSKIYERKLHKNIIYNIDNFIRMCYQFKENFKLELKEKRFSESFDNYMRDEKFSDIAYNSKDNLNESTIGGLFFNNYKTILSDSVKNEKLIYEKLDNIFFEEKSEREMTIREYFNCNEKETPYMSILLNDEWTNRLETYKNAMVDFSKEFSKSYKDKIFQTIQMKEWNKKEHKWTILENEQKIILSKIENIIKNLLIYEKIIDYFFNQFFNIRQKIEFYLVSGITGNIFPKKPKEIIYPHSEYLIKEKKQNVIEKFFNIKPPEPKMERVCNLPNILKNITDENARKLYTHKDESCYLFRIGKEINMPVKSSSYFYIQFITMNDYIINKYNLNGIKLKEIIDFINNKVDLKTDIYPLIEYIFIDIFKLPIDKSIIKYLDITSLTYRKTKIEDGNELFVVECYFFVTCWGHIVEETDRLFHTSNSQNKKELNAYSKSLSLTSSLYPKKTFFLSLNSIMMKDGDLIRPNQSYNFLLRKIIDKSPELTDLPTLFGGKNAAKTFTIYLLKDIVKGDMIYADSQFYCSSEIPKSMTPYKLYPFRTIGKEKIEVEDISNIVFSALNMNGVMERYR